MRGGSQDCPSPEQRTQWWQWGKRRVTALKGLSVSLTSGPDGLWARAQGKPKTRIPSPRVIFKKVEEGQRPPKVFQLRKMRGCSFALGTHRPGPPGAPGSAAASPALATRGQQRDSSGPGSGAPKPGARADDCGQEGSPLCLCAMSLLGPLKICFSECLSLTSLFPLSPSLVPLDEHLVLTELFSRISRAPHFHPPAFSCHALPSPAAAAVTRRPRAGRPVPSRGLARRHLVWV